MDLNLFTAAQLHEIATRSAKVVEVNGKIAILENEVATIKSELETAKENHKHNLAIMEKAKALFIAEAKSISIAGIKTATATIDYTNWMENQFYHVNDTKLSVVDYIAREISNRENAIADYKEEVSYLISGEYRPWTGEIVNSMLVKESVRIDSKEKEYAFKVFQQLRKMGVSRKAIASHLHPNDSNPHTLRYSFLVVAAKNNLDNFKAKMREWNDAHFNKSAELADLLA